MQTPQQSKNRNLIEGRYILKEKENILLLVIIEAGVKH